MTQSLRPITRAEWLAALRSGKFRQTKTVLKAPLPGNHTGYCCLGVALKLCGFKWSQHDHDTDAELFSAHGPLTMLGLDRDAEDTIARLNDSGQTFRQIADYIERNT